MEEVVVDQSKVDFEARMMAGSLDRKNEWARQQWVFQRLPLTDEQYRDLLYGLNREHRIGFEKAQVELATKDADDDDDDVMRTPEPAPQFKRTRTDM